VEKDEVGVKGDPKGKGERSWVEKRVNARRAKLSLKSREESVADETFKLI
jgi:hypothetical protein